MNCFTIDRARQGEVTSIEARRNALKGSKGLVWARTVVPKKPGSPRYKGSWHSLEGFISIALHQKSNLLYRKSN